MKKIIIIGAGDGGRLLSQLIREEGGFEIAGFIDDNKEMLGKAVNGHKVLGTSADLKGLKGKGFVISIGTDMKARARLFSRATAAGLVPVNFIHRSAVISRSARMGRGVIILANCVVNPFVTMGDNIFIFSGAVIEHDCRIGDNVYFSPGAKLAGQVKVGRDSFLGINACVIEGVSIGNNAIVGAGSCVIKDVASGAVVAGVPAKALKE